MILSRSYRVPPTFLDPSPATDNTVPNRLPQTRLFISLVSVVTVVYDTASTDTGLMNKDVDNERNSALLLARHLRPLMTPGQPIDTSHADSDMSLPVSESSLSRYSSVDFPFPVP